MTTPALPGLLPLVPSKQEAVLTANPDGSLYLSLGVGEESANFTIVVLTASGCVVVRDDKNSFVFLIGGQYELRLPPATLAAGFYQLTVRRNNALLMNRVVSANIF